jgi:hypothetical protein
MTRLRPDWCRRADVHNFRLANPDLVFSIADRSVNRAFGVSSKFFYFVRSSSLRFENSVIRYESFNNYNFGEPW